MSFQSILFPKELISSEIASSEILIDLNLDQVISAITAKQSPDLVSLFSTPVSNFETIKYRQDIMRELEDDNLMEIIKNFSHDLRWALQLIETSQKSYFKHEQEQTFLESVLVYCSSINSLQESVKNSDLKSLGLITLRDFLEAYTKEATFQRLLADSTALKNRYSTIRYNIVIKGSSITVRENKNEPDYTPVIEKTFEKFRQGAVKDYSAKISPGGSMDHINSAILDRVSLLFPEIFKEMTEFKKNHADFTNAFILQFEKDVQFYISFLAYIKPLRHHGLKFCYPNILTSSKAVKGKETFDIALASKSVTEKKKVIVNDFYLQGPERIFIVSGPNHGGKTTFARMFGQLHFLACLGCPVPGIESDLFLFDKLFTHFERKEDIRNLRGKLQDDLVRIKEILTQSTTNSIVILNEIFSSTSLQDSIFLSKMILQQISDLDMIAVCVTFIDELASFNEKTVSMVSQVDPKDPAIRTFKLQRQPATGIAYALSVAEKHGVTYQQLMKRIGYESLSSSP